MTPDHVKVLDQDTAVASHTSIALPTVDVNQVLADHYKLDRPLTFTRTMLWDMEVKKASAPDRYIPTAVMPDSAETWEGMTAGPITTFVRVSEQRLWHDPSRTGLIIEHVRVDHERQQVIFIGVPEFSTPDGRTLVATTEQPLFHVEHWVDGTETRPVNGWRIIHLTDAPDAELVRVFTDFGRQVWLRDFIEVYIRQDLGYELTRVS